MVVIGSGSPRHLQHDALAVGHVDAHVIVVLNDVPLDARRGGGGHRDLRLRVPEEFVPEEAAAACSGEARG